MTSEGYKVYATTGNWELTTFRIYWGSTQFNTIGRKIQFTPDYPFMYVGSNDFTELKSKMVATFGNGAT